MNVTPEAVQALREALDRKRAAHGFPNDNELARHLGVSPKTLSFWRNGRWSRADIALIGVLTGHQPAEPADVGA
jgi:transcriptional regulator with XRE-family HTH domain